MTLQQLHYALALKDSQSFVKAARTLGISQPALSLQVKKLETELDLVLFDRSKKRIEPTESGLLFLDRAELLINEARQLRDLANQLNESVAGTMRIGVIPTLAPYLLPLFINELNTIYSKLTIHIKEALTEEIIQELRAGTLDGGIISTPINSATNFTSMPLFYEEFKLFVSREHPLYQEKKVAIKSIPFKDVWLLKEGNCFRDQVNNICGITRDEEAQELFYFESNSIESLCHIVEFKGGITFLPELTTIYLNDDKTEMIKDLKGNKRVREISLLHLPKHLRSPQLAEFSKIIKANIPKRLLSKGQALAIPTKVKV
jgi:LysR family hydrogen peroxide-inducible transcriptional activator